MSYAKALNPDLIEPVDTKPADDAVENKPKTRLRWLLRFRRPGTSDGSCRNDDSQPRPHRQLSRRMRRLSRRLKLTEEQRHSLQKLLGQIDELRRQIPPRRVERKAALIGVLASSPLDQAAAMNWFKEQTRVIDERAAELIVGLSQFLDQLDDRQRQQLLALLSRRLERLWPTL